MSSKKPPRTSRLARSVIAGAAVARAGVSHLGHKLRPSRQDLSSSESAAAQAAHEAQLGRILFAALNQLKGTALKASQLLSMELGLLPDAMRQELARAHYQVTPLNRALVIKLMRQELGAGPDDLYAHFEAQAFAAASLGQVHAATLHSGEAVAVKLQYPGMAATIHSDLALLRGLLKPLARGAALPQQEVLDAVMHEIAIQLKEELDYLQEAEQLRWFAERLSEYPQLRLPRPVPALCSSRVLTMERLEGLHLQEWLATQPSQAERDHFGQLLFDLFLHSVFELQRLQADPHPGNCLFMAEGQLGLLDFGCTRSLRPLFCAQLRAAWCALLRQPQDHAALQQAYTELGLLHPEMTQQHFVYTLLPALQELLDWQVQPFREAVFDFGQHPPPPRSSPAQQRNALSSLHRLVPELPYFDRSYLGLLQMLRSMGARVHTRNRWISAEPLTEPLTD